jgi:hypothetical protein
MLSQLRVGVILAMLLAMFAAPVCLAAITIDLAYVDQQSSEFQRFKNWVDQAVAGNPGYAFSATDAVTMYRLNGQQAYANLAIQMVESQVAEAEASIALGNRPAVSGDSYLDAGPMIGDLALTLDWCSALIPQTQRNRWSAYAEQAVWNIWHPDQAQWGGTAHPWSGWSISDPANNYYYSFLKATMYWALATNNNTWMQLLQTDKLPALTAYFATINGGGSEEGTAYGLSQRNVFSLYRVWRDSTGTNLASTSNHLDESIEWWIHATVPTLDRVAPIGDQARVSEPVIYDYHRDTMLEARAMSTDAAARDDAAWWLHSISDQAMESGFNYRHNLLPNGSGGTPPASLTYVATGTGQLFTRTGWDTGAMWLQFSAGPYFQSHAHQNQGSFTLFEGDWLAATENIWTHSGIQQVTDVHNLVRFIHNGTTVPQRYGTVSSMSVTPGSNGDVHVQANLTPAYDGDPAVPSWQRTLDFSHRVLTVHDQFALGSGTSAVFQINVPVQPVISGHTAIAGNLRVRVLTPANAILSALDWTSQTFPGEETYYSGWRLDISGGGSEYVVELSGADLIFAHGFE